MSSVTELTLDLTKISNDTELLAPVILAPQVKSLFSRYSLFFYGFLTGATTVIVGKMAYSAVKTRYE